MLRFAELKNKELICSKDGMKIGFVDDMEFDVESYKITHLIAYGKPRLFGLLGRSEDIRIECHSVQVIGDDIILVNAYNQHPLSHPQKQRQNFLNKLFD